MSDNLNSLFQRFSFSKINKKNIFIAVALILIIGFVYYKYFYTTNVVSYEYTKAEVKDIQKTVEGSGKVVSVSELDIQQLQNGGKVTNLYVKPGDFVKSGQIIARLDSRQASIQLAQAKASYDKIVNGATKETLDISRQAVTNAKISYDLAKKSQDLAVANAKRSLFNNGLIARSVYDDVLYSNVPTISGSYTCDEETEYKISINSPGYASISGGKNSGIVRVTSVPQKIDDCGLYLSFDSSLSWNFGDWVVSVPNKLSTSYISNLNSYNSALQNREQTLANASTTILNAELSLNQTVVGARAEDIASAQISLDSANLNYENTIVRAPFDGQIGSVSAAVGQQTNSQAGIATIITKDKIAEISLNEIDIVNVKLGQDVELKFDAIPDETFSGKVSLINSIGVNTSNVVSFLVKISIPNADERIKSGMSVTANIITEKKEKVLSVPSGAIKTEKLNNETKSYVMIKKGKINSPQLSTSSESTTTQKKNFRNRNTSVATGDIENEKVYVVAGMTNDVDTEIVSSDNNKIFEGVEILSKTVGSNSTTAKTQTTFSLFGGGARGAGGGNTGTRTTSGSAVR